MAAQGGKSKPRIDKWKEKAKSRSKEIKLLRMELKRVGSRSEQWKGRFLALQQSHRKRCVGGHRHDLRLMWLGIRLRICCNVSLRAISQALYAVGQMNDWCVGHISPSTVRNWCLRLGFYFLKKPLKPGSYVLIADESVAIGKERLLVLLAVRVDEYSPIRALELGDVEVLHLQSSASWGGGQIASIVKESLQRSGIQIAYGLSDRGSNLKNAFRLLNVKWVSDCTHEIANCAKNMLSKDDALNDLVKQMNATRAKWVLGQNSPYLPPTMRIKCRFHQVFEICKWAEKMLLNWSKLPDEVKIELGYVAENRELIGLFRQLHSLVGLFSGIFKHKGISLHTRQLWQKACDEWEKEILAKGQAIHQKTTSFKQSLNDYLQRQTEALPGSDQILCCSDVIESLFGKYKNKGGCRTITDDILNIAAYGKNLTPQDVETALLATSTKDIADWKTNFTIESALKRKQKIFQNMAA